MSISIHFKVAYLLFLPFINLLLGFLLNNVHQTVLESFLVLCQSVLLPSVIQDGSIVVVACHAAFEETNARLVVWLLFKLQLPAVFHELFEFCGLATAQILKGRINFLFLDCGVLLVLASTWETLPWKRSL